jgi:hypothetical protein
MMKFNKYQTQLTDELLATLPQEVQDQLIDCLNNIEFIRRLVSPNRCYAKDRPRDDKGRIIVDIVNPHILEDMDYFRPSALHFKKYGCYTNLKPNSNPNSEYGKWIRQERDRCWNGYTRESDGEWVTGLMYFYLNYCPIILSKIRKGSKKADRVFDFPEVWEGVYWRFHYIDQMRNGGLYNSFQGGNHGAELARRGASKSYSLGSIAAHNFILGENAIANKKINTVITAYQKEYLTKDGTLNKFLAMADFCAENTQFPRRRLKQSLQEMVWTMGYKDLDTNVEKGTLNTVLGVSSKDDESKLRGKRAHILVDEFGTFARLTDAYNVWIPSVQEGDIVFAMIFMCGTAGDSESDFAGAQEIMYSPEGYNMYALPNVFDKNNQGKPKFVFFFPGYINRKGCYDDNGNSDVVKALVEILLNRYRVKYNSTDPNTVLKTIAEIPITPAEAIIKTGVNLFPVADLTERLQQLDNNPREFDDVYTGDLIINKSGEVEFKPSYNQPIREFPHKDNKIEGALEMFQMPEIDKSTGKPYNGRYIAGCLKEGELVNTNSGFKKVEEVTLDDKLINIEGEEVKIHNLQRYYNEDDVFKVKLASIIDTTTFSKEHPIYCCTPKRKYHSYNEVKREGVSERYYEYNFEFKEVSKLKVGDVVKSPILYKNEIIPLQYNDPDIWYLLGVIIGDGWVSNNGYKIHISFNAKEEYLINRCKNIVENKLHRKFTLEKDKGSCLEYSFSLKELNNYIVKYFGTGAKNKHIDHTLKTVPYNLRKNFILGYIDTDGCITRNSVNIVSTSKRLLCDIQDWLFSLNIVSSIKLLRKATNSTILGRICNIKDTYQLNIGTEGLNEIKSWQIDSMKVSSYTITPISNHDRKDVFIKDGYIYLKVKNIDIEEYKGYIYNYECDTHTFMCNYIPTHNCDPYDDDSSNTMSLGSIFILDLWTDKIVAEYTGRPMFADDFYEICRRMCLYYNARLNYENDKKGLFSYFSRHNCVYLLTDTLEFLRDKQMIKDVGYGNKAHPYSEIVYTPNGIKKWGDIQVGDILYNTYGGTTKVIDVPFDDVTDIYELTLKDGRKVRASENHLWKVIDWNKKEKVLSTKELLNNYIRHRGKYKECKYYIPKNSGVDFIEKPIKVPAYFMGIMLGDGCFTQSKHNQAYFTSSLQDLETYKNNVPFNVKTYDDRHHRWLVPNIGSILKEYNLIDKTSHTKFIPDVYKYNTREIRLNLLQGLFDTDGSIGYGGNPEYITCSSKLCKDVVEVVRSLGINCSIQILHNSYGEYYKVVLYTDITMFKLERKASKQAITKERWCKTGIIDIKYIGKEKAKCVTVNSKDSCYLIGEFITTHNSKGTKALEAINNYAKTRLRAWLLKPTVIIQEVDGEEQEVSIPSLFQLRSRALIKELINYNQQGNFDRISSMGMLMLLREDRMITYQGDVSREKQEKASANYLGNDPFFERNYKPSKFSKNSYFY